MASAWDVISSSFLLIFFLAAVYIAVLVRRSINSSTTSTRQSLGQRGISYEDGRVSIKTDRVAPSRQEYIASTQRAFEQGAKTMSLHPDAFRTGPSSEGSPKPPTAAPAAAKGSADVSGSSSAVDGSAKKSGFQRQKKLA